MAIVALYGVGDVAAVQAQSCPSAPLTYMHNGLEVLEGRVVASGAGELSRGHDAGVALDDPATGGARFLVSWVSDVQQQGNDFFDTVLATGFSADGTCIKGPQALSDHSDCPLGRECETFNYSPSVAMSTDHRVRIGWLGRLHIMLVEGEPLYAATVMVADFDFNDNPETWPLLFPPSFGRGDHGASVGVSAAAADTEAVTWAREVFFDSDPPYGLLYAPIPPTGPDPVRGCVDILLCLARVTQWQPCVAMRSDGYFIICWADAEYENDPDSPFDIRMQLFEPDGTTIGNEVLVNQPGLEIDPSLQRSPAVAFDDVGNVVVTWLGPTPSGCAYQPFVIYARRFQWNGDEPHALSSQVIVNSDSAFVPAFDALTDVYPNPTVSLSKSGDGRFIVAWNAEPVGGGVEDVHAQYFEGGVPLGGECRVNQEAGYGGDGKSRRLGSSAQHTICYGPDDEVVCAWTRYEIGNDTVSFTRLPAGFGDYLAGLALCI